MAMERPPNRSVVCKADRALLGLFKTLRRARAGPDWLALSSLAQTTRLFACHDRTRRDAPPLATARPTSLSGPDGLDDAIESHPMLARGPVDRILGTPFQMDAINWASFFEEAASDMLRRNGRASAHQCAIRGFRCDPQERTLCRGEFREADGSAYHAWAGRCIIEQHSDDGLGAVLFDATSHHPDPGLGTTGESGACFLRTELMALSALLRLQMNKTEWDPHRHRPVRYVLKDAVPDVVKATVVTFCDTTARVVQAAYQSGLPDEPISFSLCAVYHIGDGLQYSTSIAHEARDIIRWILCPSAPWLADASNYGPPPLLSPGFDSPCPPSGGKRVTSGTSNFSKSGSETSSGTVVSSDRPPTASGSGSPSSAGGSEGDYLASVEE